MKKILIVLLALTCLYCQELVVENWQGAYTTGTQFNKEYRNSNWDNFKDFAVYGYFKINSQLPRSDWSTIFNLSSNEGSKFTDYQSIGDRVLALFFIDYPGQNKIKLHIPTYTTFGKGNSNVQSEADNIVITAADMDKWAFFYISHGSVARKNQAYVNCAASGEHKQSYSNIDHNASNYYQIFVGQSRYKYFPGSIYRLTIHGGEGAYREDNFQSIQQFNPNSLPTCVTVYTQCAFTGVATNVCENKPSFDVNTVKSIYVPANKKVTFYNQEQFAGKTVVYNQSIECITAQNWSMLVNSGAITIVNSGKSKLKRQDKI